MSRFSITSPDELSIACTRRLILSPDADTIRRAEQNLGMTRQQCADHIFQKALLQKLSRPQDVGETPWH
jgi:hypothetical protein